MKHFSFIFTCYILFLIYLYFPLYLIKAAENGEEEEEIDLWNNNKRQINQQQPPPPQPPLSQQHDSTTTITAPDSIDTKVERKRNKKLNKEKKQQGQGGKKNKKNKKNNKNNDNDPSSSSSLAKQRKAKENKELLAIRKWAETLTEQDYNVSNWKLRFHSSSAADFFNGYAKKISDLWKEVGAKVNFALVGACDGLGDHTIKKLYLPNDHWRGVFVEPVSINVRDLITFMSKKNAAHRSLVIRAAATSECTNPIIKMERPLYEEKNASIPHWLRRQIGSILPAHRDHARKEWIVEEVRCVTGRDILHDWAVMGTTAESSTDPLVKKRIRRPHILKIDVEGHDYDVLMSFLRFDTPPQELPLIVEFEGKSIGKKYPQAKSRMEDLGYVVTPFGQDGFALLKGDVVLDSISISNIPPEEELDV